MKKERYFGSCEESNNKVLSKYINILDDFVENKHHYGYPFFNGNYQVDYYEFLKEKKLNDDEMSVEETFKYISEYFANVPDYNNPGTMINVIPSVNILSMTSSSVAGMLNPNFAQDTYSGDLILSELEVAKYLSDMIGWDWEESYGYFTFGGTGTNLYGNKLALVKADPDSSKNGIIKDKYFMVTSKNGHPCHYQLCDWLGIGSKSCIEIPCNQFGEIDLDILEKIIVENIEQGKTFLGYNLNGGSTNEMTIDPIKNIYELNQRIVNKYNLNYIPHIHVDAVLGWVYLFFKDYDFENNLLNLSEEALPIIKSLSVKISEVRYADTVGIDFHKTGFCPYISSLLLTRKKSDFDLLNPSKGIELKDMHYGDYNPFQISLEYSRSVQGPISALTTLKSLGKNGFRKILADMVDNALFFRNEISKLDNVLNVFPETEGLATMFLILPNEYKGISIEKIKEISTDELDYLKNYNVDFGKYILNMAVNREISFFFTSSRSYTLPNTDLKLGVLKAYPMSVFLNKNYIKNIIEELKERIKVYDKLFLDSKINKLNINNLFNEMSKDSKLEGEENEKF